MLDPFGARISQPPGLGCWGAVSGDLRRALASGRYASVVEESTEEARRSGVTGTPTFIFESGERRYPLVGAQDCSVFQDVARRMGAEARAG